MIIVTGAAGFIGSNLVEALNARGEKNLLLVDNLNHPAKEARLKSLSYVDYIDKVDFRRKLLQAQIPTATTIFHLGACSSTTETNEAYIMDNNLAYSQDLCRWALDHKARFIYASSAATYGGGEHGYSDEPKLIERLAPLNLYGLSKHRFDLWAKSEKLFSKIAGLKYFNVYGPNEEHKGDMRSVVNKAFKQIRTTGRLQLFQSHRPGYKDGQQRRDFVYVRDAVAVTLYFGDHANSNGLFNCGTGQARTWLDLANATFRSMGRNPAIDFVPIPEAIRDKYQYFTEAEVTGLYRAGYTKPFTSLEAGVEEYVEWLTAFAGARGSLA